MRLAWAFMLLPAASMAQTATRIDGKPTCQACRIELAPVVVLTPSPDADAIGRNSRIVRSSDGRWAVLTAFPNNKRILFFAPDGKYLRQLGVDGRGPGEFTRIPDFTFGPGDTLFAWDNDRLHVFAPDLKFVRDEPWSFRVYYGFARPNGAFVVRAPVREPASAGSPAHFVIPEKGIVRSYGSVDRSVAGNCTAACDVYMTRGIAADEVIINVMSKYSWTIWGDDGRLRAEYAVDSPWFGTYRETGNWIAGEVPRPTTLTKVVHDSIGRFWAASWRPPPNWTRHPLPDGLHAIGGGVSGPQSALDAYVEQMAKDTEMVIEVIDPKTRSVLASQAFPGGMNLLEWPYVSRVQENADGELQIVISRLVLKNP